MKDIQYGTNWNKVEHTGDIRVYHVKESPATHSASVTIVRG